MNTGGRVVAYAAVLGMAFAGALALGAAVGPIGWSTPAVAVAGHDGEEPGGEHADAMSGMTTDEVSAAKGLSVTDEGYTLDPLTDMLPANTESAYRFRILGPHAEPVTDFTVNHDKQLHLIVVRRDLSAFQHLHPVMAADGTWAVPVTPAAPGVYRVFADFAPAGPDGNSLTLGADLTVPGTLQPAPLPPSSTVASVDGYTVTLTGQLTAGQASPLTLSVTRGGAPVTDLDPYLGAYGHLVALRQGDLGYLHVHPDGEPGDGTTSPGPDIEFHAEVPSAGTYRLFLDFSHDGQVHTAAFTATA